MCRYAKAFLIAVLPVALFHAVGHVSACVSFSKMAVSFTHVIKAAEPVFSVVLSVGWGGWRHVLSTHVNIVYSRGHCLLA